MTKPAEIQAYIYRSESLLLELIEQRMFDRYVKAVEPPKNKEDETAFCNGWLAAWEEAIEDLGQIIREHTDNNEYRYRLWNK